MVLFKIDCFILIILIQFIILDIVAASTQTSDIKSDVEDEDELHEDEDTPLVPVSKKTEEKTGDNKKAMMDALMKKNDNKEDGQKAMMDALMKKKENNEDRQKAMMDALMKKNESKEDKKKDVPAPKRIVEKKEAKSEDVKVEPEPKKKSKTKEPKVKVPKLKINEACVADIKLSFGGRNSSQDALFYAKYAIRFLRLNLQNNENNFKRDDDNYAKSYYKTILPYITVAETFFDIDAYCQNSLYKTAPTDCRNMLRVHFRGTLEGKTATDKLKWVYFNVVADEMNKYHKDAIYFLKEIAENCKLKEIGGEKMPLPKTYCTYTVE